ncbi:MAG: LON peptidase substrate-binding domain-containing protein [Myxococcota bacterium]
MADLDVTIPLFPLESVVLFPTLSVPLYVFEPRYRQMTRDALEGDRRIGMVAVIPQPDLDMTGDPRVFDIGCEGQITAAEEQDDGTFKILLSGTRRFRILDETPPSGERLYRLARTLPLSEEQAPAQSDQLQVLRQRLAALLRQAMVDTRATPKPGPNTDQVEASLERLSEVDDDCFGNLLAQSVDFGVLEKQQLLEADGTLDRYGILELLLRFQIAAAVGPIPSAGSNLPQ